MTAEQFAEVSRESFNWLERFLNRDSDRYITSIARPGVYELRDSNGAYEPHLIGYSDNNTGRCDRQGKRVPVFYLSEYGAALYRHCQGECGRLEYERGRL